MSTYNTRRGGLRDLGECWFWCNQCPKDERRWRFGGQTGLAKHQRLVHGAGDVWPDYRVTDNDRFLLDHEGQQLLEGGKPIPASSDVPGLITTRPTKPRLYKEGNR